MVAESQDTPAPDDGAWPNRRLTDVDSLRALAHPLRVRLLELLAVHGPSTATDLSARVGESPANCSWHLRKLASGGFIEDTGEGTGRRREWRIVPSGSSFGHDSEDPEFTAVSDALSAQWLDREVAENRAWAVDRNRFGPRWRDAAFNSQSLLWLTPDELDELSDAVLRLFTKGLNRFTDPSARPPDARLVRVVAWGTPDVSLTDPDSPSAKDPS